MQEVKSMMQFFFSQSNKLVYDESVSVETVAKHLADQCQQFTQYAGARPMGVAIIIGGVDKNGNLLFLTDPSGTYISYDAVAIGANSDKATEFLNKEYRADINLEDAGVLGAAAVYLASDIKDGTDHIKMCQIKSDTKQFELISDEQISKFAQSAKEKYPSVLK